jgi:flagellar biosynthesis/type III secretory pathway M-ring protein FliF/YscJ
MGTVSRNALLAVAGLFALFGGVFPLLRRLSVPRPAGAPSIRLPAATTPDAAGGAAGQTPRATQRLTNEPQDVFSIKTDTVQTLVNHDPARTAQVIRGWIADGRGNLKQAN